jgi:serine/threonine-protein kinase
MSAQQLCGEPLDRRADVYAAGVVLWELIASRRLFGDAGEGELVKRILEGVSTPPGSVSIQSLPEALDRIVMKALATNADERWPTAEAMARELAEAIPPAPRAAVTALVKEMAGDELAERAERLRDSARMSLEPDAKIVAELLTAMATKTTPAIPAPVRARRALVVVGVLLGLGALTGGAFVIGSRSARRIVEPRSASPAETTASAPTSPPAPPAPEAAESTAIAPPPPVSSPSSATSSMGAHTGTKAHKPVPSPAPARSRSGVDCRVPYTVDLHGDRHYKAECVE